MSKGLLPYQRCSSSISHPIGIERGSLTWPPVLPKEYLYDGRDALPGGWALTGGVAIELHLLRFGGKAIIRGSSARVLVARLWSETSGCV
jgi:hypothetical protein